MLMPECLRLLKGLLHRIFAQFLTRLNHGTGGHKGTLAGKHNVELIDDVIDRAMSIQRHADDAPDHHFHGQAPFTQCDGAGFLQAFCNEVG